MSASVVSEVATPPVPPAHPAYRPDIDGLRAVAVLSVVVFHAFPSLMPGGFIGVDIFFVISGFLISSILFGSLHRGTFSFLDFYGRRIRRIFPALLVVLLACCVFGWVALLPDEFRQLTKHIAGGAGFASNFVLWTESGYFDNAAATKPLLHLWSLGIEEQFYIVWPLLLWLAWKLRTGLLAITVFLFVVSFACNLFYLQIDLTSDFYLPQARFWELLAGALLAHLVLRGRVTSARMSRDGLALAGALLVTAGLWLISEDDPFPGWWALVPVVGAVLLIAAGPAAWCNRVLLSHPVMVWFGLISFPLYLWHWPLLSFARVIEGDVPAFPIRIGAVVLAVLLSWLTYRLVEKPLRAGARVNVKTLVLLLLMTAIGLSGYAAYRAEFLPLQGREETRQLNMQQFTLATMPRETALCRQRFRGHGGHCMTNLAPDDMRPPEFLFFGDSHSRAVGTGFLVAFPQARTLLLGRGACPPLRPVLMAARGPIPRFSMRSTAGNWRRRLS